MTNPAPKTPAQEAIDEITAFEIKNGPSKELSFKTREQAFKALALLHSVQSGNKKVLEREPVKLMLDNTVDEKGRLRMTEFMTPEDSRHPHYMTKFIWRALWDAAAPLPQSDGEV